MNATTSTTTVAATRIHAVATTRLAAVAPTRIDAVDDAGARTRRPRRPLAVAVLALGLLPLTAATAGAAQDAGPMTTASVTSTSCPLTRVGTQYTRCDTLTGNGVPAPAWIANGSARATSLGAIELASETTESAAATSLPTDGGSLEWRRHGL